MLVLDLVDDVRDSLDGFLVLEGARDEVVLNINQKKYFLLIHIFFFCKYNVFICKIKMISFPAGVP